MLSFFRKKPTPPLPPSEHLPGFLPYSAPDFQDQFSNLTDEQATRVAEFYRALITPSIQHPIAKTLLEAPRDGYALSTNLRTEYGIVKSAGLANYLSFIAIEVETIHRLAELGVEKALWTIATCGLAPGLNPHHKQLEGKVYSVQKGLLMRGDFIRPSAEFGCTCRGAPIIPGFK